jgi:hypothetical protein
LLTLFSPLSFSLDFILILEIYCYDGQDMVHSRDITIAPEPSGEGTTQPKSPMDVSDDDQDEALLKLNEDELRELQKANSIQCIEGMRMLSKEASRSDISLCRMVYMLLVRPTLALDIKRLEVEFTHGYRPGAPVFYVSITNEHGEERFVKDVDTSKWDPHWTSVNKDFEAKLASNPHLRSLYSHMFFICDGTIASRHGLATLTGCTEMTKSGITQWTASAWTLEARVACS